MVIEIPDRQAYVDFVGPPARLALEAGDDWEWDPIKAADISPLDATGVTSYDVVTGETWHVDGCKIRDGQVWHVCYLGHEDRGWERHCYRVGGSEFARVWPTCRNNEARWQSWRVYYQHVLETGTDPLGMFEHVLRRAARLALDALDRPLRPPAKQREPSVPPGQAGAW